MSDVSIKDMTPLQLKLYMFFLAIGATLDFVSPFVVPGTAIFVLTATAYILSNGYHPAWCLVLLLAVVIVFQRHAYVRLKAIYNRDVTAKNEYIHMLVNNQRPPKKVKPIRGFKPVDFR